MVVELKTMRKMLYALATIRPQLHHAQVTKTNTKPLTEAACEGWCQRRVYSIHDRPASHSVGINSLRIQCCTAMECFFYRI